MRLSESLRRNILRVGVGGIINRFKARERRDVLFFEDILANYIKECEDAGYEKEMEEIGRKWMNLVIIGLFPPAVRKLPITFLFNTIARKIWKNLGLMDDLNVKKIGNTIIIRTKNEHTTRVIGKNAFVAGAFAGILNAVTNSETRCLKAVQTKKESEYTFSVEAAYWKNPPIKEIDKYRKLNHISERGFSMKNAIERGILTIKENNRLQFRDRSLITIENTLFHIFGSSNILMDKISEISYDYFNEIVKKDVEESNKLSLLKTIAQVTGWGEMKISRYDEEITITIENPPYGLQADEDNWDFLLHVILGFLWLLDRDFRTISLKKQYKRLIVKYSL